jgi:hypothetical protein
MPQIYSSANSFSKNFFKITGGLDWGRKNDFTAENICCNPSKAGKSDRQFVPLCDSNFYDLYQRIHSNS